MENRTITDVGDANRHLLHSRTDLHALPARPNDEVRHLYFLAFPQPTYGLCGDGDPTVWTVTAGDFSQQIYLEWCLAFELRRRIINGNDIYFHFTLFLKLSSICQLVRWFGSGGWRLGRSGWRGIAFDVVSIPGEVALEAVLNMRRRGEAVIFAGIYDEFGCAAEAL